MVAQVIDVLRACGTARSAYLRVAEEIERDVAQKVMCVLLWLETSMEFNVLDDVATMAPSDTSLRRLIMEASAVYNYVLHGFSVLPPPLQGIPTIMALCGGGRLVDLGFFRFHKHLVARGVAFIRDSVAALVFDDYLNAMLQEFDDDVKSFLSPRPVPAPELMTPIAVLTRTPPEDSRIALIALPQYIPLTAQEIQEYFEQHLRFGPCIERIEMEQQAVGQVAKHGVIVFRSIRQRDEVLFGEAASFYRINGDDMWMQRYRIPT